MRCKHDTAHHRWSLYFAVLEYADVGALMLYDEDECKYTCPFWHKAVLPLPVVLQIMHDLFLALASLHEQNVAHRDVKPDNCCMTSDGRTQLTDFGVSARVVPGASPSVGVVPPMTSDTAGTFMYLCPEAAAGDEYDIYAADVWAAGITFYVLLYGQVPFGANASTAMELFEAIRSGELPADLPPRSCIEDDACAASMSAWQDLLRSCLMPAQSARPTAAAAAA
ncbi:MAG: hypothetical protein EOO65_04580, partial [Methanosarcinales archaeon]